MEQYGHFAGRSGTAHLSAPARNVTGRRRSMERLRKLCGALGEEISASRTLRSRKTDRQTK